MHIYKQKTNQITYFITLCLVIMLTNGCQAKDNRELALFIPKHSRVVWVQDQDKGSDTLGRSENLMLYGYDSEDGKGERALLANKGNFFKPLFTPDGRQVVFSNRKQRKMFLLDWNSGKVKELGEGVAVEVWREPEASLRNKKPVTWVYYFAGNNPENKYGTSQPMYRFPIDNPEKKELVWNKTNIAWSNIQVSKDGRILGGLFPWPHAGILNLDNNKWQRLGRGCWTSLSPDNSKLLWIFDGRHRNLQIHDTKNNTSWQVNINSAPDINGYEVYHPRWSNHPRYMVMTGPYEKGEGGNRIGGGGEKVEIYVGKFDNKIKRIEQWLKLSNNNKADFYPDLWIKDGEQVNLQDNKGKKTVATTTWPNNEKSLLFVWENMKGSNQLPETGPLGFKQCSIQLKGEALFSKDLQLIVRKGWGDTGATGEEATNAIANATNASLETVYTPLASNNNEVILSFIKNDKPLLTVLQKKEELIIQTATGEKIKWANIFTPNQETHLVFNISNNRVELFTNGNQKGSKQLPFEMASFKGAKLVFGNKDNENGGLIENIAVYNQSLPTKTINKHFTLLQEKNKQGKPIDKLEIMATLMESSEIPQPNALGTYSRALVLNLYQVNEVLKGDYKGDRIVVAEWAVLDRNVIKSYPEHPEKEHLLLEKFSDHPELEGERQIMDIFEPDIEVFYRLHQP